MPVEPAATARLLRRRVADDPWIAASGSSMLPTIAEGSRLRVELTDRAPRVGEVWLFVAGSDDVIAHRFVRRQRGGRLVFVGDTAPRADPPVPRDRLVGRVVELECGGVTRRITRGSGWRPMLRYVTRGVRRRLSRRDESGHAGAAAADRHRIGIADSFPSRRDPDSLAPKHVSDEGEGGHTDDD